MALSRAADLSNVKMVPASPEWNAPWEGVVSSAEFVHPDSQASYMSIPLSLEAQYIPLLMRCGGGTWWKTDILSSLTCSLT